MQISHCRIFHVFVNYFTGLVSLLHLLQPQKRKLVGEWIHFQQGIKLELKDMRETLSMHTCRLIRKQNYTDYG